MSKETAAVDYVERARLEVAKLQKQLGSTAIVEIGEQGLPPSLPSGLQYLDWATYDGGIPPGGITLLYGPRGCGKTSLAHLITGQIQQNQGCGSIWISSEGKFNEPRAVMAGVDLDKTIRLGTSELETALELIRDYVRQGGWNPIVLDSISNLSPRAIMKDDSIGGKEYIGHYSKRIAAALRQYANDAQRHGTSIIIISHVVSSPDPYAPHYGFHGGNNMEHNALLIVEMKAQGYIKPNFSDEGRIFEDNIGKKIAMAIRKNKRGPEGRQAFAYYLWDRGFDPVSDRILLGLETGVLQRGGAWYTLLGEGGEILEHNGQPLRWQGLGNTIADLQGDPEKLKAFDEALRVRIA